MLSLERYALTDDDRWLERQGLETGAGADLLEEDLDRSKRRSQHQRSLGLGLARRCS